PAEIILEDEDLIAIRDVNPQAPIHVLVIPKKPIPRLSAADAQEARLLGKLLLAAAAVAEKLNIADSGFRVVINNGIHGGETVPHLHIHLLGGRHMSWPPG
ncbi:MAG: HIT domain-containing protein, partial [Verrucomicrobia bacterium]|nr:HIT domain-containing protein [Verrucomicrobiota bacterium]